MVISVEQRHRLLAYIVEFAQRNQHLRICVMTGEYASISFNLGTTFATRRNLDQQEEPTLYDLQQLNIDPETGLPFNTIHLRTGDSGPGLADIKFENSQFIIQFFEGGHSNTSISVTDFFIALNAIITLQPRAVATRSQQTNNPPDAISPPRFFIRNSAEKLPEKLASYIDSFKNSESFLAAFKRLAIEIKDEYTCNISLTIPDIPVFLAGQLYDFSSLKKLPFEGGCNYRKNPMTREKFTWDNVMPGRAFAKIFENLIQEAEQKNTLKCTTQL
jgi:hypothetical protein